MANQKLFIPLPFLFLTHTESSEPKNFDYFMGLVDKLERTCAETLPDANADVDEIDEEMQTSLIETNGHTEKETVHFKGSEVVHVHDLHPRQPLESGQFLNITLHSCCHSANTVLPLTIVRMKSCTHSACKIWLHCKYIFCAFFGLKKCFVYSIYT